MHKAQLQIKETLPKVDLFIELLDARIPFSSTNPMLADLRGEKPCLKVLSKSDLADPAQTSLWQAHLERETGVRARAITTTQICGELSVMIWNHTSSRSYGQRSLVTFEIGQLSTIIARK